MECPCFFTTLHPLPTPTLRKLVPFFLPFFFRGRYSYTKAELLQISRLPASNMKPANLDPIVDKDNKDRVAQSAPSPRPTTQCGPTRPVEGRSEA